MRNMMICMVMVTKLLSSDNIRRRTNLASRHSPMVGTSCCLCCYGLWWQRSAIAHTIAVSEHSIVPLWQGATVAKLWTAGSKGGTTIAPLDPVRSDHKTQSLSLSNHFQMSPEWSSSTASFSLAISQQSSLTSVDQQQTCDDSSPHDCHHCAVILDTCHSLANTQPGMVCYIQSHFETQ